MHPHLVWLVREGKCPNCWSEVIQADVDSKLEKVNFKCCRCDWKLCDINYSDVSKLITVIAFQEYDRRNRNL